MKKCTIQIVDLSLGIEQHVRKITLDLAGFEVLTMIEEVFAGHIVSRKNKSKTGADRGQKSRTERVK